MVDVIIKKENEVYIKIYSPLSIAYELRDHFSFKVPNCKFMPSYKSKMWDGYIRLFNPTHGRIYGGLREKVEHFCRKRGYEYEYMSDFSSDEFSLKEAKDFVKTLNLPFEPREYQYEGFVHAIRERRSFLLSPTASGKSLIIYLIYRYLNSKTLIIVPNLGLIKQMAGDFKDYGYEGNVHTVYYGQEKVTNEPITVSTWQSLYKMPKEFFNDFGLIIGDEAHGFKADSLTTIMKKLINCPYRVGVSGTLDGAIVNEMVLEGLFAPIKVVTTTSEMIENKQASPLKIKCIVLEHTIKKKIKEYKDEIDYIISLPERNKFIKNLALSLEGNTLVLFKFEKHGRELFDLINKEVKGRNVYFVSGLIEGGERDIIRKTVENEKNAIIVGSMGTFSTGINIKSLKNLIFTSPTKDKIRILQSIGRVLRKSEHKNTAILFDLADQISKRNFTILHFMERVKLYAQENFDYKIYNVRLKVDEKNKHLSIKQASLWDDDSS